MQIEEKLEKIEKQLELMSVPRGPYYGAQYVGEVGDEIDLRELWNVLWNGKWLIMAVTFVFAIASVLYALSLPNIYKSEVLLAPAEENSGGGLAGKMGQLGGLASLAGVNLDGGGADKTTLVLEILKSKQFLMYFIEKHDLLVPVMAAKGWDRSSNSLILDSNDYNAKQQKWVRKSAPPFLAKPSLLEAYEKLSKLLTVFQDKKTKFVKVSIEFYSPKLAKEWVELLVEDVNHVFKKRELDEAKRSINYLSSQLDKTSVVGMQSVFYELIEEQTKTIMFAEVRDEYAFKTIDGAVVPEKKAAPKRGVVCFLGVFLGGMFSVFLLFIRFFLSKN